MTALLKKTIVSWRRVDLSQIGPLQGVELMVHVKQPAWTQISCFKNFHTVLKYATWENKKQLPAESNGSITLDNK